MTPPGLRLRAFAARLCDAVTMSTVIDPAIADLQHECEAARRAGDPRTRPSLGRYAVLWQTLAFGIARSVIRAGAAGFVSERALVRRTLLDACTAGLGLTLLLTLPPWLFGPPPVTANHWLMLLCLLPQAAAIGIPIGLSCALVFAMRTRPLTVNVVAPLSALALLASGVTVVMLEWLVPEANEAFRTVAFGRHLPRGLGELGLTTLARRSDPASILTLHARLALVAATFTLTAPGLVLVRLFRRPWMAVVTWSVSLVLYFACVSTLSRQPGPRAPILAAWGPTLVFGALATAMMIAARPLRRVQRGP